jgi:DNA-binding MarR family transcriptional regulator
MERKQIIEEIAQQMTLIKKRLAESGSFSKEVSPAQYGVLQILSAEGQQSSKDVALRLAVTPGAVTQLVDPLVERGLLERTASKQDRRVINLRITQSGETALCVVKNQSLEVLAEIFSALSESELRELNKLVSKIRLGA